MSVLGRRCLRRAHLVEELVEEWQIWHREALFASDVEELVYECVDLGKLVAYGWKVLLDSLFKEEIDNLDAAGKMMGLAIERSLEVFPKVERLIGEASRREHKIDGVEKFRAAVQQMRALKADVETKWPTVNYHLLAESKAAFAQGEYQSTEELLHGLENGSAKAD